jgi:hypothetical protein
MNYNNNSKSPPAGDSDAAVTFLQQFHPGGPWHLVSIADRGTTGQTFTAAGPMRAWIEQRQGRSNLYFHVNSLKRRPPKHQATKAEVTAALYLHDDVDDASDIVLARLRSHDPAPTAIVFSGGGFQAFWKLSEPTTDLDRVEAGNRGLTAALGGDNCHNINRVMRIPGTVNVLNKKKRASGRTPALAYLVEADWKRSYGLDQFSPPATAIAEVTPAPEVRLPADVPLLEPEAVPGLDDATITLLRVGDDPERPRNKPKPRYPSRSHALFGAVCRLVRADCNDATIAGLILNPVLAISESVLDKPKPRDYARKQIAHARKAVAAGEAFPDVLKSGQARPTLANTKVALGMLGVDCAHDLFKLQYVVNGRALDSFVGELSDPALLRLRELIYERFEFDPTTANVHVAVQTLALHHCFHPVRDYLDELRWDGVPRIDRWLTTYGGADDSEYVRAVGALMLTAAVRRVRQPGCKFDEMLVLENPEQGNNRSSALQLLAVRREWFSDNLPLGRDAKETIEALSGRWIVEASELHGMRNADIDKVKAFASRGVDRARMAYARTTTEAPRQCVIIGTTNNEKYLRDLTGNRRFWPVRTGRFDLDALKRDRDQLWAEAAAREAAGASIRLPEELWPAAAAEQQRRVIDNPFTSVLDRVLRENSNNGTNEGGEEIGMPMVGKITIDDVWKAVGLGGRPAQRNQHLTELLGAAMRELGWERPDDRQRVANSQLKYVYVKGPKPHKLIQVVLITGDEGTAPEPVAHYVDPRPAWIKY